MTQLATDANTFTSARNPNGRKKPVNDAALNNENQRTNQPLRRSAWDHIHTLSPEDRGTLFDFHLHCLDAELNNGDIANILGYHRSNIGRILTGKYKTDNWPLIASTARAFLESVNPLPAIGGLEWEPEFIPTTASQTYWLALDYASRGGFAIIAGDSGAGKTKTVNAWADKHPGTLIRVNAPISGGVSSMMRLIAHLIGI